MNSLQKQRGIGLINLVVVLLVCAFCGTFAFKVVPMYAENRYIIAGMKDLVEPGVELEQMTDAEIRKKMNNYYMLNNVRSQEGKKIEVIRNSKHVIVKIDYEARAAFFYNIEIVTNFKNHLDSEHPHECCDPVDEISAKSTY